MLNEILEMISEITDVSADTYKAGDNLITDIGLSSFEIIQLISKIEQTYDIRVQTSELEAFTTPENIADYIQKRKK